MSKQFSLSLFTVILFGCVCFAGQNKMTEASAVVGTWAGSWTGSDGSGNFEMTITKGEGGKLTGSLTARPVEGDGFTARFKSIDVSGNKLIAKFDDPDTGQAELLLEGTIESSSMKGTYSINAQGEQVESGTWEAKKKSA